MKITMHKKRTTAIAFSIAILFASVLVLQAQEEVAEEQEPLRVADMKLTEFEHTPWEDTTITLLNPKDQTMTEITAKKATYRLRDDFLCRVTAFKSAYSESYWIGPERDFYIEMETGISGGVCYTPGGIRWCQSLVPKSNPAPTTLDSAIKVFEQETDVKTLVDPVLGHKLKSQEEQIWNATDLRRTFARGAGAFQDQPGGNSFGSSAKISRAELEGGEIKITIENPVSSFRGVVWIDPTTRKVTRSAQLSPAGTGL